MLEGQIAVQIMRILHYDHSTLCIVPESRIFLLLLVIAQSDIRDS